MYIFSGDSGNIIAIADSQVPNSYRISQIAAGDIDNDNTGLAAKFGVRSVPTTVVVSKNKDFQKIAEKLFKYRSMEERFSKN